jgi:hypothetical protein
MQLGQQNVLADLVQCIAARSPDGAVVLLAVGAPQQNRLHPLVVVQNAIKRRVHAIADVVHEMLGPIVGRIHHDFLRMHIADQCKRRRHIVTARFGDHLDTVLLGKVVVQRLVDDGRHLVDGFALVAGKATTNIENGELVAQRGGKVEQVTSGGDRFVVDRIVGTAAAHVETDTDNVEIQSFGHSDQLGCFADWVTAELLAQRALSLFGVAANAQNKSGKREKNN